ncbi:hypothetical protein D3C80_1904830 [compost metagenome]
MLRPVLRPVLRHMLRHMLRPVLRPMLRPVLRPARHHRTVHLRDAMQHQVHRRCADHQSDAAPVLRTKQRTYATDWNIQGGSEESTAHHSGHCYR